MSRAKPNQPPVQQAPPAQRMRVRYAKRGRLRFTSHRDFSRAFERALVRARIPMAYSSGFNPHPRISYAGAAPTGAASEAEFLEIALAEVAEPDHISRMLDEALPDGLDILAVVVAEPGGAALADLLEASRWRLDTPWPDEPARLAVEALLGRESVLVERMTKKGLREFDVRAAVLSLTVDANPEKPENPGATVDLVLRHGSPAVRPDDVVTALAQVGEVAASGVRFTRLAQGPLPDGAAVPGDPLA